jgi:hypothetical protein
MLLAINQLIEQIERIFYPHQYEERKTTRD